MGRQEDRDAAIYHKTSSVWLKVRYTGGLILTLTINPALDHNVFVDRLAFEDRGYILSTSDSPGGRGINASRVIHQFGSATLAIAP